MVSPPKPVLRMQVGGIVVDPNTQAPIVLLRGIDEPRLYLPIFIGSAEATAIATCLAGLEMPRPMTHDLMTSVLQELGAQVQRITVTDLIDGTFYAELSLADESGHAHTIDARPSDSIALALRAGASIYVARSVLEEAGGMVEEGEELPGTQKKEGEPDRSPVRAAAAEGAREAAEKQGERRANPAPVLGTDVRLEDLDPDTFGKYKM